MNIKAFKLLLFFFIAIDNDGTLPKTINRLVLVISSVWNDETLVLT